MFILHKSVKFSLSWQIVFSVWLMVKRWRGKSYNLDLKYRNLI